MKQLICSLFAASLVLSTHSVLAATNTSNMDDASALGTSATPQIVQQNKTTDSVPNNKSTSKKSHMHKKSASDADMKMMDTNSDGMISKDEYMNYYEQKYGNMKQTDGMVNMKDMRSGMSSNSNSMNNKPIGTTSGQTSNGSVDVTKSDSVNGTHTGTNN